MNDSSQLRTYDQELCVVFRKTNERFGGLSNMAAGFPLRVNGVSVRTSEALYQACRFPHMPEVQKLIISENSPMTAKMRSKPFRDQSREDWNAVRTKIMRWCLRVKLAQNWRAFGDLLLETGDKSIVEYSSKDDFWGAQPQVDGSLQGMNVLGRLLMELREQIRSGVSEGLRAVEPLPLENFLLYGKPIEVVGSVGERERVAEVRATPAQGSLFGDAPLQARVGPQMGVFSDPTGNAAPESGTLPPYTQMRASGLDWLGEIPAHWEVRRAKYLVREVNGRSERGEETHLSMSQKLGLVPANQVTQRSLISESYAGAKLVETNDLVLNRLKAHLGVFAHARQSGVVSPDYTVLRPLGGADVRFMEYVLKSPKCRGELRVRTKGIVEGLWRLYTDDFYDIRLPLPPLEEQRAIVRFLDWHGAQVSRLLRAKKRLIALLNEQKQAIIHRAVTRGLDETVPLKPSGISWLGDIPAHWELKPNWSLFSYRKELVGSDHPKFRLLSLTKGGIIERDVESGFGKFSADMGTSQKVRPGEFVFCLFDMQETPRTVGLSRIEGMITGAYTVFCPQSEMVPEFFEHYFLALDDRKAFATEYSGLRNTIRPPRFLRLKSPVPPIAEQNEIVLHLDQLTAELDHAVNRIQSEITLIQEYRTRLIADVVTGKLDVRALAEALPDTPPDELATPGDDPSEDELLEDAESDEEAAA